MWFLGFAEPEPAAPEAKGESSKGEAAKEAPQQEEETTERRKRRGDDDPMVRLVPWLISLLIHAAIVAITLFVVWTTVIHTSNSVVPAVSVGQHQQQSLDMSQSQLSSSSHSHSHTHSHVHTTPTTVQPVNVDSGVIGLGSEAPSSAPPFGASGSGTGNSGVGFGGSQGSAHHIAYVIDASGSLIDSLPFVIRELEKSIRNLHPPQMTTEGNLGQSYAIIFFRGKNVFPANPVLEVPPKGMTPASVHNKLLTMKWLSNDNVEAGGQTDPIPALKRAMTYRPELIFLLSDNITGTGQYELNQGKLIKEIMSVVGKRAKINTIQFLHPDVLASIKGQEGTMKLIADKTGGTYTFYSSSQLDVK